MAVKKSELYSSLWQSCDALRGGMDASQYKDYVLVLLFVKYVSDKYAGKPFATITVPPGASFADMVALKGKSDIGDQINKKIIGPLEKANDLSFGGVDFNDAAKLGNGKEMVDRLTDLVSIFENPALDFSRNRADGDDILGDAYEYLMRHFATESGKSKGQFYTPAEVSRVIAQVLGVRRAKTSNDTTVYDPTCGSGSLLLRIGDEARHDRDVRLTLYGQEKDNATAGLARMNMILHDYPTAVIAQGNTLTDPKFRDGETLQTFDYVVANPPFSDKRWSTGLDPEADPWKRFEAYGVPPAKQGDYAYLLHILRSLKSGGQGACILPHGVLFRGNAEAAIRRNLIERGYIKGIIGLPPNLFYGTGIPACIVVLDKAGAAKRQGLFIIDASRGFKKDGPKNRLREQDIHRIVDTFAKGVDVPRYARMVPVTEIAAPKNDYNLNLPRYIDSSEPEDLQDIDGHLRGGIPERDLDAMHEYWQVMPGLRAALSESADRHGYAKLRLPIAEVKATILGHPEFTAFQKAVLDRFDRWRKKNTPLLMAFDEGGLPKALIESISEDLLATFHEAPLLDPYSPYQRLMDFWAETMQDDAYLVAAAGWTAQPARLLEKDKKGKTKDRGWTCDLLPKAFVVARYFIPDQAVLDAKQAELKAVTAGLAELEEEHSGEEGFLGAPDGIAKGEVTARLKEAKGDKEATDEVAVLSRWLELSESEAALKRDVRKLEAALDERAYKKYPQLTDAEIKTLVIDDKWMAQISTAVHRELDRVSQTLTGRIRELAERYAAPVPQLVSQVETLAARVEQHLKKMGASWK